MYQVAIFVDAGYLFAQGSAALSGAKVPRHRLRLNVPAMLADLHLEARAVESQARLLRIYWYDGLARSGSLSPEQRAVADAENVKCRFGIINSAGEQKGVDSLIVTDMIELARGKAISDALILSGDEDIRVGVQVTQGFGIRVHLLGIHPARGSQSPDLLAEADTRHEWGKDKIGTWMTVIDQADLPQEIPQGVSTLEDVITQKISETSQEQALSIIKYADDNRSQLPPDFDRPLLGKAKSLLGRDLDQSERKHLRIKAMEALRIKSAK